LENGETHFQRALIFMNPSPALAEFIEKIAGDPEFGRTLALEKSDNASALACSALAVRVSS
jgi:hypothetical protein